MWGQFCLCHDGQKLVTETDYIIDYGIKDGDQVCLASFSYYRISAFSRMKRAYQKFHDCWTVVCRHVLGSINSLVFLV